MDIETKLKYKALKLDDKIGLSIIFVGVLAGLLIRLFFIGYHPLDHDELVQFELISKMTGKDLMEYLLKEDTQMPLVYWITDFFYWMFGPQIKTLRVPSLIFSILSMFIAFNIPLKIEADKNERWNILYFISLSSPAIIFSHSIRPYSLLIMLSLLTFFFYKRLEKKRAVFGFIVCLISLCLTHYYGVALCLFFLGGSLKILFKSNRKHFFATVIVSTLLTLIFSFLLGKEIINDLNVTHFYRGTPHVADIVGYLTFLFSGKINLFLFLLIFLLLKPWENKKIINKVKNLLIFTGPLFLGLIISYSMTPSVERRYLVVCLTGIFFFQAIIIEKLSPLKRNIVLLLFMIISFHNLFLKEQYLVKGRGFEPDKAANIAINLSQNNYPIFSCGNCLKYYLGKGVTCTGRSFDENKIRNLNGYILVTYAGSREICKNEYQDKYFVEDQSVFINEIGIVRYKLRD